MPTLRTFAEPIDDKASGFVATNSNLSWRGDAPPSEGRRQFVATNLLLPLPRACRPLDKVGVGPLPSTRIPLPETSISLFRRILLVLADSVFSLFAKPPLIRRISTAPKAAMAVDVRGISGGCAVDKRWISGASDRRLQPSALLVSNGRNYAILRFLWGGDGVSSTFGMGRQGERPSTRKNRAGDVSGAMIVAASAPSR